MLPKLPEIDKGNLDEDWVKQDRRYEHWAALLAKARYDYDKAKDVLKVTEAECEKDVRDRPDRHGLKRVTDSAVKMAVALCRDRIRAQEVVNRRRYEAGILEARVQSLEHRKKALEDLVTLDGREYFARPRAPKDENVRDRLNGARRRAARNRGSS